MRAPSDGLGQVASSAGRNLWIWWTCASLAGQFANLAGLGPRGLLTTLSEAGSIPETPRFLVGFLALAPALTQGLVVGLAQGWVLHRRVPHKDWRGWWLATAIGTLATSVPAVLIFLLHTQPLLEEMFELLFRGHLWNGFQEAETALRVSEGCVWGSLLGTVSGPILGLAQWWVLRDKVRRGGLWILVHTCAWLFMIGVSLAAGEGGLGSIALIPLAYAAQGLGLARLLHQGPLEQP
jgi:hypothetical protein